MRNLSEVKKNLEKGAAKTTDHLKDLIKKIEKEAADKKERDAIRLRELQQNENLFVHAIVCLEPVFRIRLGLILHTSGLV